MQSSNAPRPPAYLASHRPGFPLRPQEISAQAHRLNLEQVTRLGGQLSESRRRRRLTQREAGRRSGLSQGAVSLAERGLAGRLSLDTWQRLALAVGRRLQVTLSADTLAEPADAGHLAIQELVLRLGRGARFLRRFELPTRPAEPWRSADVGLRDDRRSLLILVECWNTIGDVGAAARASERKRAEAEDLGVAIGGERRYSVRGCWVVRATARNRALVGRYPEVFAARFPGSSAGWVAALTDGTEPPSQTGLLWCDVRATRLFAWRHR